MDVRTYLESPERLKLFSAGRKVEATKAAPEELSGLEGTVIYVKRDVSPAVLVSWHAGERTPLPPRWKGQPRVVKHRPRELKVIGSERWDEYGDYPVPMEWDGDEPQGEEFLDQTEIDNMLGGED